jgi:hypothetical protein
MTIALFAAKHLPKRRQVTTTAKHPPEESKDGQVSALVETIVAKHLLRKPNDGGMVKHCRIDHYEE